MQAKNWGKVKEMLREVLELEPSKRREFLEKAETTAEIRAEVESLLAFEAESEDFMSLPITDFSKDFVAEDEESEISLVGRKIGNYEITAELGFGGMGAVYLADRCDGKFSQRVAIKMLKREFNVEKIRRNFKREREIQAKLNHPNIATLLDAGTTDDGVPYLVMEFIEGAPIDKYCAEKNLALDARLKLFNKVCDAVSFAHRNLIIHRDLKPSNILVNEKGEPKLLDFGISKLLDAEQTENEKTLTLLGAMTPEYASPEQIKGESVTTATDIYSLSLVLYKILTSSHPFDLKGKTNGELLKIISENEPLIPSDTLQEREKGYLSSKISPSLFLPFSPSELKGDLDNIILKALSKEAERRYQTVEQFSADIWRFIDGLPILARPSTLSYRASKFYGRNKVAVLAAAFIFISLIAGISTAVWQASVAREQARIAAESQKLAEIEAEKAKKISDFMAKIIAYANPKWFAEGAKFNGEAKVIDALLEMSDKIETEFPEHADIRAELHHKFAEAISGYYSNGNFSPRELEDAGLRVRFHIRRARALRREFYGERHELVAKDMAYLYWSDGVEKKDKAKYLAEAIKMMRETNPHNLNLPYMLEAYTVRLIMPDTTELHEQYLQAVIPPTAENKYQIAERYLLESLPIFREHYKEDNQAIYGNECRLAYTQLKQNKVAEAAPHLQICRQGADKLDAEIMRIFLDPIEKFLAAQKGETPE